MSKSAKIGDRIRILKQELGGKSTRELEMGGLPGGKWLLSNGLLSKWENKSVDFSSTDLEAFLNHYNVNRVWWKTLEGPVFNIKKDENNTPVQNEPAVAGNTMTAADLMAVLQDVLAERSDYRIIPKTVLDGEYRLLPLSEIEHRAKELESRTKELEDIREERKQTLEAKNKLIKRLEDEIAELRGARNPAAPQGA